MILNLSPQATDNKAQGKASACERNPGYGLITQAVAESDEQYMPQSLFKVLIHVVFSTKNRADLITSDIENGLFGYIHGIVENNKSKLILINGTTNHVHLLISLGKLADVPELIGDIKRSSSFWIKRNGAADFYWQKGYGVFSIGQSQVATVTKYISNQKEHHKKIGFEDEYREFLNRYEIEYDERYMWD